MPRKAKPNPVFNAQAYLDTAGVERSIIQYRKKKTIFRQGETGNTVLCIQEGTDKLTVVSEMAKRRWLRCLALVTF